MPVESLPSATQQESRNQIHHPPRFLAKDSLEVDDCCPHFLAQDLNNEACALIERKNNIPQAIRILEKALELSKWNLCDEDRMETTPASMCQESRLDAVIFHEDDDDSRNNIHTQAGIKRRFRQETTEDQEVERYIHRKLFRVNKVCIQERYYMGMTLVVMILWNLAIAHQLLAVSTPTTDVDSVQYRTMLLDRALKLYELCILAHNSCECSDGAGLRLKMLVMNNLGEIHWTAGSPTKHRMCVDYLLRGMMFMVDGGHAWLRPEETDGIYRNIQATPGTELQRKVHAGAA